MTASQLVDVGTAYRFRMVAGLLCMYEATEFTAEPERADTGLEIGTRFTFENGRLVKHLPVSFA
jgi:hypothetical protein